jgi:hypothetical protein
MERILLFKDGPKDPLPTSRIEKKPECLVKAW